MTPAALLLALVTLERVAELWLARRNTKALVAHGAVEVAAGHYPLIVLLHALWLVGQRPVAQSVKAGAYARPGA